MRGPRAHEILTTNGTVIKIDQPDLCKLPKGVTWTIKERHGDLFPMTGSKVGGKHVYLHVALFGKLNYTVALCHLNGDPTDFRRKNVEIVRRLRTKRRAKRVNPFKKIPLQVKGEIKINGCTIVPKAAGRCDRFVKCSHSGICLDTVAHNTSWMGFARKGEEPVPKWADEVANIAVTPKVVIS